MSFRLITSRLFKHSKVFLNYYCKRNIYGGVYGQGKYLKVSDVVLKIKAQSVQETFKKNSGLFRLGQHARKLFVDNFLNQVKPIYSADIRNQTKQKLFYGDSMPFLTLIGVTLASGSGILSKENDLEIVCEEIREAASRFNEKHVFEKMANEINENFTIDKLDVGPPIAKGCAAVVYSAALKTEIVENDIDSNLQNISLNKSINPVIMPPIQHISRFINNLGTNRDDFHQYLDEVSINLQIKNECDKTLNGNDNKGNISNETGFIKSTKKSENTLDNMAHNDEDTSTQSASIARYPLALKMMFNYDIQSNSIAILKAMHRETIPAKYRKNNSNEIPQYESLILPPHPNIVMMLGYFCGEIQNFRDGHLLYPGAQPARINPNGYGRNMSLYLLMKRYETNLREYLHFNNLNVRNQILILAQLLEAVAHINRHGIAHRDLKSDNILIETTMNSSTPLLVISDFGCCLADSVNGLQIPYNSEDIDKGGNAALMAPEIITQIPGMFRILSYKKSDLWAVGAISYEIFGLRNPFYKYENEDCLKSDSYNEADLPDLPNNVPYIIQLLIKNFLEVNPASRLSPDIAANVMQIFLWAPKNWLKCGIIPTNTEILQWLLSLTIKIMCEKKAYDNPMHEFQFKEECVEYILISSFLSRSRLNRIRRALNWIQNIN